MEMHTDFGVVKELQQKLETSRGRLKRAKALAAELGCTPNQIALAFLTHQTFPVIPIIGTTNPAHLADAIGALQVDLTPTQVAWLRDGEGLLRGGGHQLCFGLVLRAVVS